MYLQLRTNTYAVAWTEVPLSNVLNAVVADIWPQELRDRVHISLPSHMAPVRADKWLVGVFYGIICPNYTQVDGPVQIVVTPHDPHQLKIEVQTAMKLPFEMRVNPGSPGSVAQLLLQAYEAPLTIDQVDDGERFTFYLRCQDALGA